VGVERRLLQAYARSVERSTGELAQAVLAVIGFVTAIVGFAKLLRDGWGSIDVVLLWAGTAYLVFVIAILPYGIWKAWKARNAEKRPGRSRAETFGEIVGALFGLFVLAFWAWILARSYATGSYGWLYAFGALGLVGSALGGLLQYRVEQRLRRARVKKCPDCAENVKAEARVCRYCGYRFASPSPPPA
jgi:hypothetical protein